MGTEMPSETDPEKATAAALIDACVGQLPASTVAALRSTLSDGNLDEGLALDMALYELAQIRGSVPDAVRAMLRADYAITDFPICMHHAVLGIDPKRFLPSDQSQRRRW